jgi:hypothetical protein
VREVPREKWKAKIGDKMNQKLPESAADKVAQMDVALDKMEGSLGIPGVTEDEVSQEAKRLLALFPAQIRGFSAADCGYAAYTLEQLGFRLQQSINREQARITMAEESIKKVISQTIKNFSGGSYEERRLQAVNDRDDTQKWDAIRVKATLRIDKLAYLSTKAEKLAMVMMSLQNTKRGQE